MGADANDGVMSTYESIVTASGVLSPAIVAIVDRIVLSSSSINGLSCA